MLCSACANPIRDLDDVHFPHEADCPDHSYCRCDLTVHPKCCTDPDCTAEGHGVG